MRPLRSILPEGSWNSGLHSTTLLLWLALSPFVTSAQSFRMPNDGMAGTLKQGVTVAIARQPVQRNSIIAFKASNDAGMQVNVARAVGMPGDTIQVRRGVVYVNGRIVSAPPKSQLSYTVTLAEGLDATALSNYEVAPASKTAPANSYTVYLSKQQRIQLEDSELAEAVEPNFLPVHQHDPASYQSTPANGWNRDYYGPVIVPRAGAPGVPEDYYFVLGDNRHKATDSRVFGPLAASAVLGVVAEQ